MNELLNSLGQYGILGIFTALLIGGLVAVFKMLIAQVEKRLEQTQKDLDHERESRIKLQERFDDYIAEDRQKIVALLDRCTSILDRVERKLNG
jgi:ABC-type tungstate transport system substrate-binding protein